MYLFNTPLVAITYLWIPASFQKKKHMKKFSLHLKLNVSNLENEWDNKSHGFNEISIIFVHNIITNFVYGT